MPDDDYAYLTTTGRRSGRPHTIEIWYADGGDDGTLYLLSGGRDRADWVGNLRADAACTIAVGRRDAATRGATARILDDDTDESAEARRLVHAKYAQRGYDDLDAWRDSALPVALDVHP